jgi:hypothetical protein
MWNMLFEQDAPDWKKLRTLAGRDGDLRLSHFRRVKQLGSGDVGLVDLVQIQVLLFFQDAAVAEEGSWQLPPQEQVASQVACLRAPDTQLLTIVVVAARRVMQRRALP